MERTGVLRVWGIRVGCAGISESSDCRTSIGLKMGRRALQPLTLCAQTSETLNQSMRVDYMFREFFSALRHQSDPGRELRRGATDPSSSVPRCVEVLEERLVLSATINTGIDAVFRSASPSGGIFVHKVTDLKILEDTAANGVVSADASELTVQASVAAPSGATDPPPDSGRDHGTVTLRTTNLKIDDDSKTNEDDTFRAGSPSFSFEIPIPSDGKKIEFGLEIGRSTGGDPATATITNGVDTNGDPVSLLAKIRVNNKPTAVDKTFTVFRDTRTPLDLNSVVTNGEDAIVDLFGDAIDETLEVTILSQPPEAFTFEDKLGNVLGMNSDFELGAGPDIFYTPPAGKTGGEVSPNTFTFSVSDGTDDSETRTITLSVVTPTMPSLANGSSGGNPVPAEDDDTGRSEPDELQIGGLAIDKVTKIQEDLTFFGDANSESVITLVAREVNSSTDFATIGPADITFVGTKYVGTFTATKFPEGTYDIFTRIGGVDSPARLRVNIDTTDPPSVVVPDAIVDKGTILKEDGAVTEVITGDNTPGFSFTNTEANGRVNVERTIGVTTVELIPLDPPVNTAVSQFNEPRDLKNGSPGEPLPDGEYTYAFKQEDLAENDPAVMVSVVVDTVPPAINMLSVDERQPTNFGGSNPLVVVTSNPEPEITFKVTEQQFATIANAVTVQVLDESGADISATAASFTVPAGGPNPTHIEPIILTPTAGALVPGAGQRDLEIRVTDAAGNVTTQGLTVFVLDVPAPTPGAPGTPVFTHIFDLDEGFGVDSLLAKNRLEAGLPTAIKPFQVWQMAFDNTTQTVWFTVEHGTQFGQFDPATGKTTIYDLNNLDGDIVNPGSDQNPHGMFFDFDGHVNPRVWIVHRNAGGDAANTGGRGGRTGRVSYFDIRSEELVTFDLEPLLADTGLDIETMHAVFTSKTGTIWATATHSNNIVRLDFDPESVADSIDAIAARITVFDIPDALTEDLNDPFEAHALDVVVDDKTGEEYVWLVSVGGSGRLALLRPGAGPAGKDVWTTWEMPSDSPEFDDFVNVRLPFAEVDDNETPGDPRDDRVIFVGPNAQGITKTRGLIFAFDPGINPDNPMSFRNQKLKAFEIPLVPGQTGSKSAPNQPFVDRAGHVFYVDRLGSVGRFDPDSLTPSFNQAVLTPVSVLTTPPAENAIDPSDTVAVGSNENPAGPIAITVEYLTPISAGLQLNRSTLPGADQFELAAPSGETDDSTRGQGAFRGALNATNVLFGSLAQADMISTTVFGETARRQMAVVESPATMPDGTLVEGRMAFQVLRNGSVIMTHRANGEILDKQLNLTRQIALAPEMPVPVSSILFDSDPSAVVDWAGNVHVFGRKLDSTGRTIVHYRLDSATGTWSSSELPPVEDGVLPGTPMAFIDSRGDVGVLAVQNLKNDTENRIEGHLMLYRTDGSAPTDLTAMGGVMHSSEFMFGNVDIVEDTAKRMFFAYGANMQGDVVEYSFSNTSLTPGSVDAGILNRTSGEDGRDTNIFQSVYAVMQNGERHIFGIDGNTRLVQLTVTDDTSRMVSAQNITELTKETASGYFDFQQEFAARVYSGISVLVSDPGDRMFVYGTNGSDLVLFIFDANKPAGQQWTASNLTNDTTKGNAPAEGLSRVPGNNVFGAPGAYITENGDRHILQINAEGEVVEFHFRQEDDLFVTNNINLAAGNSVQDLADLDASLPPLVSLSGQPVVTQAGADPVLVDGQAALTAQNGVDLDGGMLIIRTAGGLTGDMLSLRTDPAGGFAVNGDVVSFDGMDFGEFAGGMGTDPLTVTKLNEAATLESVQALLRNTVFETTGATGSRFVEVALTDGNGARGATATRSVVVVDPVDPLNPLKGSIV